MNRNIALIIVLGLAAAGCASAPWNKNQAPPVELLDESEAAAVDQQMASASVSSTPLDGSGTATAIAPPAGEQRFKDIPLPQNVKEDLERTYVYESSRIQVGRMVYTSKASINELAQFYIQECPKQGWKLENVLQAEGVMLAFSKPDKRLNVNIRSQGVGRSQLLVVTLTPVE